MVCMRDCHPFPPEAHDPTSSSVSREEIPDDVEVTQLDPSLRAHALSDSSMSNFVL